MTRKRDDTADLLVVIERLLADARAHLTELETYRDRIAEVEKQLHVENLYRLGGLTGSTRVILGLLMKREMVYRSTIYAVLYGGRPEVDQPSMQTVDQFLFKLRRALSRWDILLHNRRGGQDDEPGYFLTPAAKERILLLTAAPLQAPGSD